MPERDRIISRKDVTDNFILSNVMKGFPVERHFLFCGKIIQLPELYSLASKDE